MKNLLHSIMLMTCAIAPVSAQAEAPSVPIFKELTPEFFDKVKREKKTELLYLETLERENGFPEGTFRIKWAIESMCGYRNVKNKKGYKGHFQYGPYEIERYKVGNPMDFKDAANALPRFLSSYHKKFQTYARTPVEWGDRTPTDWYNIHNMGFRGAAQQFNTVVHKEKLPADIRRNMLGNIPTELLQEFKNLNDRDFTLKFYQMWDSETFRIWKELKD